MYYYRFFSAPADWAKATWQSVSSLQERKMGKIRDSIRVSIQISKMTIAPGALVL